MWPLHLYVFLLQFQIVQLLLRHSADITLRNYEGQTAVEVASGSIRSLLLESVERSTEASHHLLLQAAWQGDIKVIKRLLVSYLSLNEIFIYHIMSLLFSG